MKRLTPQDLQGSGGSLVLVDVRSREEYDAGHLDGARHIPLSGLPARLGELPSGLPVVTYGNMFHPGSSRGEKAAAQLQELGFDVGVLEGGYPARQGAHPETLPLEEPQEST